MGDPEAPSRSDSTGQSLSVRAAQWGTYVDAVSAGVILNAWHVSGRCSAGGSSTSCLDRKLSERAGTRAYESVVVIKASKGVKGRV